MDKEDVVHIIEYNSAVRRNNALCNNMDGLRTYHILSDSESLSQTEKDKYHMKSLVCGI